MIGLMPEVDDPCGVVSELAAHAGMNETFPHVAVLPAPSGVGPIEAVNAVKIAAPNCLIAAERLGANLRGPLAQRAQRQGEERRCPADVMPPAVNPPSRQAPFSRRKAVREDSFAEFL